MNRKKSEDLYLRKHGTPDTKSRIIEKNVLSKMRIAEWGRGYLLPRVRGGSGIGADDPRSVGPVDYCVAAASSLRSSTPPDAPTRDRRYPDTPYARRTCDRTAEQRYSWGYTRRWISFYNLPYIPKSTRRRYLLAPVPRAHISIFIRGCLTFHPGEHDQETPTRNRSARSIA